MSYSTCTAKLFAFVAILCAAAATIGCKGTPIDVAKGRPSDSDIPDDVKSDYETQEPTGWARLAPENVSKEMKKAVGLGPNQKIAEGFFDEGEKFFEAKQYDKAAKKFASAADRWPNSTLEEDSMFLEAESYFFADRYPYAEDEYEELLKKYPNTHHLDATTSRQFAIGRYWQQEDELHHHWVLTPNWTDKNDPMFDTAGHASNAYNSVRVNDPRGPLADCACMTEGNMAFRRHRWEDADYYYNIVRTDYPKSKYQLQAHLLGVQCKLLKYQGPGYNSKPLEEANQLIDQTLAQFPNEIGAERERLVRAKAEVKAQMATRDLQLAQYWDKGDHYGAARIYYAQVLKEYPQTPFADQAKTRLAALEGKPNEPPSRLAFLTDWAKPKSVAEDVNTQDRRDTFLAQQQKDNPNPLIPAVQSADRQQEANQNYQATGESPVQTR
ncbi:MAG TPA: outer membrane protein assembly factor BamD [Pirellulales bacterium]|jgi:outer membrane protein assembly factor BamD (BamD/ComL family)|nr:outer membrane protein assembly factor BamD [Pirellulales bacterium]